MHVPIEYHRRVVTILAGTVILLFILLIAAGMRISLSLQKDKYLKEQEVVVVKTQNPEKPEEMEVLPVKKVLFEYVEVIDGCGTHFQGTCLNVRSGPGEDFPSVNKLRNGIVLKVGGKVDRNGHTWYKIVFDEPIRYPERVTGDWYVSADYVRILLDEGDKNLFGKISISSSKRIVISRSEQILYAYDKDELFLKTAISTGIELTPTPRGNFTIFKKTPSRYMQGPIPGIASESYDLPGVPWDLYFTYDGAAIHGTYWHENFGKPSSHGCVNLPPAEAEKLYNWADIGMPVIVQD